MPCSGLYALLYTIMPYHPDDSLCFFWKRWPQTLIPHERKFPFSPGITAGTASRTQEINHGWVATHPKPLPAMKSSSPWAAQGEGFQTLFLSGQRLPRRGWLGAPCQTLFTLFITRLQGWSFQDVTEKSPGISLSSECSPALIQATGQPQFWQAETGIYSAGRLKE